MIRGVIAAFLCSLLQICTLARAQADFDVVVFDVRSKIGVVASVTFVPSGKEPQELLDTDAKTGVSTVHSACNQGDVVKIQSKDPSYSQREVKAACRTPKVEIELIRMKDLIKVGLLARQYEKVANWSAAAQVYSELYAFTGNPDDARGVYVNVAKALDIAEKDAVVAMGGGGAPVASETLMQSIEAFQKKNGLIEKGYIGSQTLKALSGSNTWTTVYAPLK